MKRTKTYTSEYCYLQVKRKQCSGTIEHSINITFLLIQNRRNKDKKFKRNNKRTIVKVFFKKNEHYIFVNYTKKCFHIHKQGLKKIQKVFTNEIKMSDKRKIHDTQINERLVELNTVKRNAFLKKKQQSTKG